MQGVAPHDLIAIVRPPSDALARCEVTHVAREPIDLPRARSQHATYVATLGDLGAAVTVLPPEPDLPDAVFVEDVAVVFDELAVITNPGAASRRAEVESVAGALVGHRPLARMPAPATLDGGDVMVIGRSVYVGRSTRTNAAGIAWLRARLAPLGYAVSAVDVHHCLHLKSACSSLGGGLVLANPRWVDVGVFRDREVIEAAVEEPRAANTFRVGDTLVMAEGFPATRAAIEARGFAVRAVDLSELQKAEAGGSCLSLVFPGGGGAPGRPAAGTRGDPEGWR